MNYKVNVNAFEILLIKRKKEKIKIYFKLKTGPTIFRFKYVWIWHIFRDQETRRSIVWYTEYVMQLNFMHSMNGKWFTYLYFKYAFVETRNLVVFFFWSHYDSSYKKNKTSALNLSHHKSLPAVVMVIK